MAYSERLKQVLGEPDGILAGVSGGRAALRIGAAGLELSNTSVIDLKKGLYGRDGYSVRILARAYAKELLERFGSEIERRVGDLTPESAEQWLLWVANPRLAEGVSGEEHLSASALAERLVERAAEHPEELTYEPDLESFSLKGFPGAENLQPKSLEVAERIMRAVLTEERKRQGRE